MIKLGIDTVKRLINEINRTDNEIETSLLPETTAVYILTQEEFNEIKKIEKLNKNGQITPRKTIELIMQKLKEN